MRDEAFAAWRRYFEELAEERPLVLVFEDLHWADDHLLDFVDHLVDWATGVPLLVVCTARPELLTRRPDWGGGKPNALTSRSRRSPTTTPHVCSASSSEPFFRRRRRSSCSPAPAATRSTPRSSRACSATAGRSASCPRPFRG